MLATESFSRTIAASPCSRGGFAGRSFFVQATLGHLVPFRVPRDPSMRIGAVSSRQLAPYREADSARTTPAFSRMSLTVYGNASSGPATQPRSFTMNYARGSGPTGR